MARFTSTLDHVRIAAPCSADWDQMFGNDRARFCAQCNLNVYNLSSMTRSEAESFIAQSEGRLCVRFYRRKDGSILTDNCPVGLRAMRRRLRSVANAISVSVLSFLAGIGFYRAVEPIATIQGRTMGVLAQPFEGNKEIADSDTFQGALPAMGKPLFSPYPLTHPTNRVETRATRPRGKPKTAPTK